MKKCSRCGEEKPVTDYQASKRAKDGLQAWCKSCMKLARKKWTQNNPERAREKWRREYAKHGGKHQKQWRERHPERNKDVRLRARLKTRQLVSDYKKEHGCESCRIHDPRVLDLHHRDAEDKVMAVSQMISRKSIEEIMKEMEKCRIICANCHRIEHYKRRQMKGSMR